MFFTVMESNPVKIFTGVHKMLLGNRNKLINFIGIYSGNNVLVRKPVSASDSAFQSHELKSF